jgi:hypothetical protein
MEIAKLEGLIEEADKRIAAVRGLFVSISLELNNIENGGN